MATEAGPATDPRPTLAVWKFASCDGCQLTLLDCEDELLDLTERVRIDHFLEMTPVEGAGAERARLDGRGPYDLSLVEGSITTAEDAERIQHIRSVSGYLVTIGACATAGGIQALRNFADVDEFLAAVYAQPEYISTLETSTPISAHVPVDFELRGCPIDRRQLLEVITAYLAGRKPRIPSHSVCFECKRRGTTCITVAHGTPCLGPVTHAGCGAICPAYGRGCYGCFGPTSRPNLRSMVAQLRHDGMSERDIQRVFRTFNAASPEYAPVPDLAAEEQDSPRATTETRPERPA
jgi:coenzyme F420-reducing hydrogenase gamma subunit